MKKRRCCQGSRSNSPSSTRPLAGNSRRICARLDLVLRPDGDLRVFSAEFDKRHAPARLDAAADRRQHRLGMRELVIDIDQQEQVDGRGRKPRVVHRTEDRRHVSQSGFLDAIAQQAEHLGLDVDRQDTPTRADQLRQRQRVIPVAASEIADRHPRPQSEIGQQQRAPLLLLTLAADQPRCAVIAHRLSDRPPHVLGHRRRPGGFYRRICRRGILLSRLRLFSRRLLHPCRRAWRE